MAMAVKDAGEDVFEASQTRRNGRPGRSTNYTEAEDAALLKAWEGVRLDAVTGNDQEGKGYWQRITNRFYQLMPEPSARSSRSLRSRYDVINHSCSRWSACLEQQARNAPPSGCTVDDYAQEIYKQMAASKGKTFVLHHCWKLLEHSEKWNLMDQEGPPPKKWKSNSPATDLDASADDDDDDDDEEDDDGGGGGGGGTMFPSLPSSSMMTMIDGLMKSKKEMKEIEEKKMALEERRLLLEEKKIALEERRLLLEEKKIALDERRLLHEEKKMRQEITVEENKLMMMDPNGMDEKARACWEIRRGEIMQSRRSAAGKKGGDSASGGGTDGDGDGGGNNVGDGHGNPVTV